MAAQAEGSSDRSCRVRLGDFPLLASKGDLTATGRVRLVIRPERIELEPQGTTGENRVPGMVERVVYVGATTQLIIRLAPGETVQMLLKNEGGEVGYQQGTPVSVHLPASALRVLAEP
jgi:spermidine/putrescine transport system ATP-binding protein